MTDAETKAAHAWQALRTSCIKLAIKANAEPDNVIKLAREFADFIMIKSGLEPGATTREADTATGAGQMPDIQRTEGDNG